MLDAIAAAILWVSPHVGSKADEYADLVAFEAKWYGVHPLLIVAVAYTESRWRRRAKGPSNDYGLMQIHVGRRRSNRFYRREKALFVPRINIREGTRLLAMWKRFHNRWCRRRGKKRSGHLYWSHYKWGSKVRSKKYERVVNQTYRRLVRKFWTRSARRRYARTP